MKKTIFASLLFTPLAFSLLLGFNKAKQGMPVGSNHEFAKPGLVAYAASYDSSPANEPKYSTQNTKTFQYLNLGQALDYYRGDAVKVGIIDSGINYDHEDFMVSGNTKVKGDSKYYEYQTSSWVYYKASQHGYSYVDDSLGHGTNVAATVAAAINGVGGLGLAPNVELYVYKVTNSNNGYEFGAIQNALMDAKTLGLDIINMSFQSYEHAVTYNGSTMGASSGCSSILTDYLNSAYNAGITLVAAAGNYNTNEPSYPGSNNHVINVGSLSDDGTDKAPFSNYGSTIDLVAPGYVHVAGKTTNGTYTNTQGTSFSAPLVTAAIALYKQKNPSATPSQIETALYAACDPIDDSGSPYTNWAGNGALNVSKLLDIPNNEPTEIVINNPEIVNEELSLEVGDTLDLDWTVNGVGTFDDSVSIYNYDDKVLSVTNAGQIEAIGAGEDLIYIESTVKPSLFVGIAVTVTSSAGPTPTVSSVTVSPANLALDLNGTKTGNLSALVVGDNNPSQTVTWNSSNSSIVEVSAVGVVTGKAIGTATITATSTVDTTKSGTCTITVSDSSLVEYTYSINATTNTDVSSSSTSKVVFAKTPLTVTIDKHNSSTSANNYIASSNKTRIYQSQKLTISVDGKTFKSITISNTAGDKGLSGIKNGTWTNATATGDNSSLTVIPTNLSSNVSVVLSDAATITGITVVIYQAPKTLSGISISTSPSKTVYEVGECFDPAGLVISKNYSDSTSETVAYLGHEEEFTFSPSLSTSLTKSDTSITITHSSKSCDLLITVNDPKALNSISISGYTTTFKVGSTFAFGGTVTANFNTGNETVTGSATFTGYDLSKTGKQTVTVSYTFKEVTKIATYDILVCRAVSEGTVAKTETYDYSSGSVSKSGNITDASNPSTTGYSAVSTGNGGIQCASGNQGFTLTITTSTTKIAKVTIYAKQYSDSEKTVSVAGQTVNLTSTIQSYDVTVSDLKSITISTSSKKRFYLNKIIISTAGGASDISLTEDCIGLETFVAECMHMDYVDNLGYCKDNTHHYYSTARDAFNALNSHQRSLFTSNSAYESEWTRLSTWAAFNGESLDSNNLLGSQKTSESIKTRSQQYAAIVLISIFMLSPLALYWLVNRKKKKTS